MWLAPLAPPFRGLVLQKMHVTCIEACSVNRHWMWMSVWMVIRMCPATGSQPVRNASRSKLAGVGSSSPVNPHEDGQCRKRVGACLYCRWPPFDFFWGGGPFVNHTAEREKWNFECSICLSICFDYVLWKITRPMTRHHLELLKCEGQFSMPVHFWNSKCGKTSLTYD